MYQSATGYHFCAHWYLMMVANCLPEIPAYIASKASANFSESSADADDPCTIIHFVVYSKARKWKLPPLITHFYIDSDLTPDFGAPKSIFFVAVQLICRQTRTNISWTTIWKSTSVLQNPETDSDSSSKEICRLLRPCRSTSSSDQGLRRVKTMRA